MSAIKSLNYNPKDAPHFPSKALSDSEFGTEGEYGDIYGEDGYENFEDFGGEGGFIEGSSEENDFSSEEMAGADAASLRQDCQQLEAQVRTNSDLSAEAQAEMLKELTAIRGQINRAQGMGEIARQAAWDEIQAKLTAVEGSFQMLPEITETGEEIDDLIEKIQKKELPGSYAAKKAAWVEKLEKVKTELDLNLSAKGLENAQEAMEEVETEFEEGNNAAEELNDKLAAPIRGMVEYLEGKGQTDVSEASIRQALQECGLSEKDLQNITLPSNAETHRKLFEFIKKVDTHFAQLLTAKPNNPYAEEIMNRFKESLDALLPTTLSSANVQKIFDDSVGVALPSAADIIKNIAGDDYADHAKEMLNHPDQGLLVAIKTGNWDGFLSKWIKVGDGLDWNKGHAGSTVRRLFGAIFAACDNNPTLFEQVVRKSIPENVIRELTSLLNRSGQHSQLGGDILDKATLVGYLDEALGKRSTSAPAGTSPAKES